MPRNDNESFLRFARLHAEDRKHARKTNAEIIYEIVTALRKEGISQEAALMIADDVLCYMEEQI